MLELDEVYRRLDPAIPLTGEALVSQYVDRPIDPVALLAQELLLRDTPLRVLLVGQRGIGKSTELERLKRVLFQKRVCFIVDLRYHGGIFSVADAIAEMIHHILEVDLAVYSSPGWTSIKYEVLAALGKEGESEFAKVSKNLTGLNRLLKEGPGIVGGFPPVLLIDGCERLPSEAIIELLAAIRRVNASFVVVAPPRIALGSQYAWAISEWDRISHLPAISVQTPSRESDPQGTAVMRSILDKRGVAKEFDYEALDLLIQASAGIHRELLTLAQQACVYAKLAARPKIMRADAMAVMAEKRNEYSYSLTPEDWALLVRCASAQTIALEPKLIPLIDRNVIISYRADWTWFGIHPLLHPRLELMNRAEAS